MYQLQILKYLFASFPPSYFLIVCYSHVILTTELCKLHQALTVSILFKFYNYHFSRSSSTIYRFMSLFFGDVVTFSMDLDSMTDKYCVGTQYERILVIWMASLIKFLLIFTCVLILDMNSFDIDPTWSVCNQNQSFQSVFLFERFPNILILARFPP